MRTHVITEGSEAASEIVVGRSLGSTISDAASSRQDESRSPLPTLNGSIRGVTRYRSSFGRYGCHRLHPPRW